MPPLRRELYIRRLRVDEALARLDRYLNDAFLSRLDSVRVVHGKGTGALRDAVRQQLSSHPLVKAFRPADYGEGDEGVTIVEIVERGSGGGRFFSSQVALPGVRDAQDKARRLREKR